MFDAPLQPFVDALLSFAFFFAFRFLILFFAPFFSIRGGLLEWQAPRGLGARNWGIGRGAKGQGCCLLCPISMPISIFIPAPFMSMFNDSLSLSSPDPPPLFFPLLFSFSFFLFPFFLFVRGKEARGGLRGCKDPICRYSGTGRDRGTFTVLCTSSQDKGGGAGKESFLVFLFQLDVFFVTSTGILV